MPIPAELFLSHSSIDQGFADQLGKVLDRHHIPYWYSRRNLVGAKQWHDEIGLALDRCDWFAVILSPEAVDSRWVQLEFIAALREQRFINKIIPLLYKPCEPKKLSWTLGAFQFVDFAGQTFEDGCRELLRAWSLGYIPPPS